MRKQLLFTLLLAMISNLSFASFNQGNWRWRNNDGNEATATWRAPQNTPIEITSLTDTLRLRMEIQAIAGSSPFGDSGSFVIYYGMGAVDSWIQLTTDGSVNPFKIVESNRFLTPLEPTQGRLQSFFSPSNLMASGTVIINTASASFSTEGSVNRTYEYELVIVPTDKIQPGQNYRFSFNGNTTNNPTFPGLTTPATLPIVLKSLTAKSSANGIQITWSTASETDNKFFNLQRSVNGINWESIAKIDGSGTTNSQSNYSFLDANPLNGINYYRLAQHDADGKINYSGVSSANFDFGSTALSVYPNPFVNQLSVNLSGYSGKTFETRLTNTQGQAVFQKQLIANENGINIHLNQAPIAGVYVLSVKGNGVNLVKKVSVK